MTVSINYNKEALTFPNEEPEIHVPKFWELSHTLFAHNNFINEVEKIEKAEECDIVIELRDITTMADKQDIFILSSIEKTPWPPAPVHTPLPEWCEYYDQCVWARNEKKDKLVETYDLAKCIRCRHLIREHDNYTPPVLEGKKENGKG